MDEDETQAFSTLGGSSGGHRVGEPLDSLSVQELGERIEALKAEIARLEEARAVKQQSLSAAAALFKF